jgi:hypothetical protein
VTIYSHPHFRGIDGKIYKLTQYPSEVQRLAETHFYSKINIKTTIKKIKKI